MRKEQCQLRETAIGSAPVVVRNGHADRPSAISAPAAGRRPLAHGLRRWLFLGSAGVFFLLGALGAILPVLPATPFLLLTSYFLVRSSPRLNQRLLRSRLLGPILTDWQVHGGVRPDVKVQAIVMVVIVVGLTLFFTGGSLLPNVIISSLAAIGIIVIARLPTAQR